MCDGSHPMKACLILRTFDSRGSRRRPAFGRTLIVFTAGLASIAIVACSSEPSTEEASSSAASTVARAGDSGRDARRDTGDDGAREACPVTPAQTECGRACAGEGPVRPLLESLII